MMSTISLQLVCKYPFINRFHGESEAGGCILIVTNLPNAYVAESSVAGCIFSLIQNIFSLLFFDTVLRLKLAKRPLSNRRDQTQKKHAVYWKSAMSDHAKTLVKPKQTTDSRCVLLSEKVEI